MERIEWVECPRDAMQGLSSFIPTAQKINYINRLIKVGFDVIDFGSFVSPKAIPQMQDTAEVLAGLHPSETTKLLAIVANERGGEEACSHDRISILGYPLSISETFQIRNTNRTISESMITVARLQELCVKHGKELVVYISMAFGNPYGDPWSPDLSSGTIRYLETMGIRTVALADTVGIAEADTVKAMFNELITAFPTIRFGAHLHCTPTNWVDKVQAAFDAGCRRFDSAMKGYGGCPMANNDLVGNLASENLLGFCQKNRIDTGIDEQSFQSALESANFVFSDPHAT